MLLFAFFPALVGAERIPDSTTPFEEFLNDPPTVDFSHLARLEEATALDALPEVALDQSDTRPRVAFLGGTFIHRMSEFGYVETELTRLCPERSIVFRNLGWPGDDIQGRARVEFGPGERERRAWQRPEAELRDYGFRKMMDHIGRERPHVLFIGYGPEVALEPDGLRRFHTGLPRLLESLEPTGMHVILVTPPPRIGQKAHFREQNMRLAEVAAFLRQVASDRRLLCVDVFGRWDDGETTDEAASDNGIHLNARGYRRVAHIMAQELGFGAQPWSVTLDEKGTAARTSGSDVGASVATEYGFVATTRDNHLPSVAGGEHSSRRLWIEGLATGRYALDCDGRRIAHADAEDWSRGVTIGRGPEFEQLERLRQMILEKNRLHFYGFRPQNKAYIHLFRRHERGHHEGEVERFQLLVRQAEEQIARLRAPRRRHLELVRERDYPDHEVPSRATTPDIGRELASFEIPAGFEITLFASDPMVANPININWDERGRMWVATSTIYPHLQPGQTPNDRIVILEDIDQDGRADKSTTFADDLLVPHSVLPGHGGVYVTQSTDLLFLRDIDGDDRADERVNLLTGFGNADVHHMIHGLRWGPDGDLYFHQSIYINSFVETPWGVEQCRGSCLWRLRPETLRLTTLSRGLVNPWGHAFDDWGQSFATDGAGGGGLAYLFPGSAFATHGEYARELPSLNPGRPKECGLEWLSGRHLPDDWQATFLTCDFRANRVTRYQLSEEGSGYSSEFLGDVVTSRHRAFRPVDVKVGPDGAVYIVDWYNLIIDHGEVDFHHPLRDKGHGRIWRLAAKDSPRVTPPRLADGGPDDWLDALTLPEQWSRDQARRLLRERGPATVLPALRRWLGELDPSDPRYERLRLEALWVYQGLRSVDPDLLDGLLNARDHHVRAAATRVLADWKGQVSDATARLATAVMDPHPQVRLEAVNVLRTLASLEAAELALRALDLPLDANLDFALWRTARELAPYWLPPLQAGERVFDGRPERIAFALTATGKREALAPLADLLRRGRLEERQRFDALRVLAVIGDLSYRAIAIEELSSLDSAQQAEVLAALVTSPQGQIPPNAANVLAYIESADARLRQHAIQLAGRWRLHNSLDRLDEIARSTVSTAVDRQAAARALVEIDKEGGLQRLRRTLDTAVSQDVQATALWGMAAGDVSEAAARGVELLAANPNAALAESVFEPILGQRGGIESLIAALADTPIPADIAVEGVRIARESGQDVFALTTALERAGGLQPVATFLTPDEIAEVLAAVVERGDPHRGEQVFRRQSLNCLACHAIEGEGGKVGPDLSSLGGSAQLGDLLQSLVAPSEKIKEGFRTHQVVHEDGRIITGTIVRRTPESIQLRTAKDDVVTVLVDEIEEEWASDLSMMPNGLAQQLKRDELVDLVRYLSTLGLDE